MTLLHFESIKCLNHTHKTFASEKEKMSWLGFLLGVRGTI